MEKRLKRGRLQERAAGNRGRETRPKSPAKQALFASAKNRQRNRCGRRAESGKVCFQRDLLEKRGRKGRLFSANADKGDKKGEKRAKSCGKGDARKRRDGAKEQKLRKAQNRRGEFICRGRNPLGAEKQRKDDFTEKTFVWKAGVIFSKKVWTDRERDFFVREEKSGGAEKKRNLYLFPEEGGRSVQGGRRRDLSCFLKKTPLNAERGGAFFERFPAKKELAGGRKKKGRAFLKKARRTYGKNGSRKRGNFAFSKKEESVKFVNVC